MNRSINHKVLIVDDDSAILYLCGQILAGSAIVTTAGNAFEAGEILLRGRFDLLVTDYEMPGRNGLDLVLHLRNPGNLTPVIVMSGTPSARNAFEDAGVVNWRFLDKPFRAETFRDLVRRVLSADQSLPDRGWELERQLSFASRRAL